MQDSQIMMCHSHAGNEGDQWVEQGQALHVRFLRIVCLLLDLKYGI